jgi:hypothetical protein
MFLNNDWKGNFSSLVKITDHAQWNLNQTENEDLDFFGPYEMALAYRLNVISQGPKKSRFQGPNPLPLALIMDAARIKSITNGAV